jgi:nitroreductase
MTDTILAGQNIMLMANALNIKTCYIGQVKEKKVFDLLSIDSSLLLVGIIALGYNHD